MKKRRHTKKIMVGGVPVGGQSPVSVQSMTSTDTRDASATIRQIRRLERAGCDIVRVAVPDEKAAAALSAIVKAARIPVIADIHFSHRLALLSLEAGVHGLRINPGNIGAASRVRQVVVAAGQCAVPIRIGINSGSLEKDILKKYGSPCAEALAESALRNVELIESMGFDQIKISIKSADVRTTIDAYRLVSKKTRYPLHIGVTEAGTLFSGTVKSSIGLGVLLHDGIGDTLRVSLSADPVEEVRAGFAILQCLGLRRHGPELISCPTCGRRQIDVVKLAARVEKHLLRSRAPITVAVMGCEVNGPGEAREADIGIAGSSSRGVIFKKGRIVKRCAQNRVMEEFLQELDSLEREFTSDATGTKKKH
jgi:(E)-4-hydroxy-3-methylbut-2-enyl-diphosphate synthase